MVRILAMLGLVLASPAVAGDRPTPFLLSVPATSAEPLKSDAEVQFVSNGYWLSGENCVVTRSSGNAAADKQACETVIFRASAKPNKNLITSKGRLWRNKDIPIRIARQKIPAKNRSRQNLQNTIGRRKEI